MPVEGLRRPLAVAQTEGVELDVGEVEPVHREMGDGRGAQQGRERRDEVLGERRLTGAGRTGDPDGDPAVRTGPLEQSPDPLDQRLEVRRREQA